MKLVQRSIIVFVFVTFMAMPSGQQSPHAPPSPAQSARDSQTRHSASSAPNGDRITPAPLSEKDLTALKLQNFERYLRERAGGPESAGLWPEERKAEAEGRIRERLLAYLEKKKKL